MTMLADSTCKSTVNTRQDLTSSIALFLYNQALCISLNGSLSRPPKGYFALGTLVYFPLCLGLNSVFLPYLLMTLFCRTQYNKCQNHAPCLVHRSQRDAFSAYVQPKRVCPPACQQFSPSFACYQHDSVSVRSSLRSECYRPICRWRCIFSRHGRHPIRRLS